MNKKPDLAILAIFLAVMALCCQSALATATTHIWAPSTDVQGFGVWHITSDIYLPVERDALGNRLPAVTNLGLTVGILPSKKLNAEVGFDHKSGMGQADNYPFYSNIKVGIPENAFGNIFPAIAMGLFDVGLKKGLTDYDVFYGKLAKSFTLGKTTFGRFSLGYFAGNKKLLLDANGQKDNSGVLAAWEWTLPELSDKFWFCIEYMGTKSVYGALSLGAAWKFASNVAILGGYEFYNNTNLTNTFTLQVDVDF